MKTFKRLDLTAILKCQKDIGPIGGNLSHEFIILAETVRRVKFLQIREFFNVESEETKLEKNFLIEMRKLYEQFYSVTDEKFNKEEFENKVSERKNRLTTKGIES